MNDETKHAVREWIRKAENDLLTITNNMRAPAGEIPYDTCCFHAQQAAEKYLKAYLTFHGRETPFSHNLAGLARGCLDIDPSFADWIERAEELTPFGVAARYPDEGIWPTLDETQAAWNTARELKKHILGLLGDEFRVGVRE